MRPSRMLLLALLASVCVAAPAHAIIRPVPSLGVEELIWDRASVAHRNHIHIGLTKAGAARRTSFWSAAG
jgi:hypothetical protein